jgi:hypothetical protein
MYIMVVREPLAAGTVVYVRLLVGLVLCLFFLVPAGLDILVLIVPHILVTTPQACRELTITVPQVLQELTMILVQGSRELTRTFRVCRELSMTVLWVCREYTILVIPH